MTFQYAPLHQCPICRNLAENEYGFYAVMLTGPSHALPPEADRLRRFDPPGKAGSDTHHLRRCPVCDVFYQYDEHYEYDVTSSEDELYLTRLTPTEARAFMDDAEFQQRLSHFEAELTSPHPITKQYAAKRLMAHYLARENAGRAIRLINNADNEVQLAVLRYLTAVTEQYWRLDNKALIKRVVATAVLSQNDSTQPLIKQILWHCGLK